MRIVLIFIFISLVVPTTGFAIEPLFTEKELETIDEKIESLYEAGDGEKSRDDIWKTSCFS